MLVLRRVRFNKSFLFLKEVMKALATFGKILFGKINENRSNLELFMMALFSYDHLKITQTLLVLIIFVF